MIKKVVKRSNKTSVKVNNKASNKANKNKRAKNKNKQDASNKKANNISLANLRKIKENEEEDEDNRDKDVDLSSDDEVETSRSQKRKRQEEVDKIEDCELNYKLKSYLIKDLNNRREKTFALPIKTEGGYLVKNTRKPLEEPKEAASKKIEKKLPALKMETFEKPKTMMELIQERKMSLEKNKEKIAMLSREVLENPQEEMKKLKELRTMLSYTEVRNSFILRKLIVTSLSEIYKDIIPSYKIRAWTDKENEQSAGKDVKALKDFEETLVRQYKLYLDYVSDSMREINKALWSSGKKDYAETYKTFGMVCIKSLMGLLEHKSHFNFTPDIIEIIVQQLTNKTSEISQLSIECIKKLFKADKTLKLSLEITQKITKLLKQKSYGVRGDILNIFLSLKLKEIQLVEEDEKKKMSHKEKQQMSRKDRKKLKEKAQLSKDLEENRLKDTLKAKSNMQTRILEQIFIVYFNILKKAPNFKLIPCVLEGLAKFAHLINLEFFDDIVKLMHNMIESEKLTFRSKLHCIKTVFIVLSGRGEALTIDPMRFYNSLYNIILRLDTAGNVDNTIVLAECIDMMFFKRRKQIPSARLIAFIKRLSIVSLQMDSCSSAIVLDIIRKLISLNPSSDLLFDNEYQDSGIYQPEVTQPDYANAQNSSMWGLHLLRRHYTNAISGESVSLLKDYSLTFQDSKRTTQDIVDFMDNEDKMGFEKAAKGKKGK